MRYLFLIVISLSFLFSFAQDPENSDSIQYKTVFAELVGTNTNFFGIGKSATIEVDFGEEYFKWIPDNRNLLVDENGKAIKFNSMVDGMNFMGARGWKFEAAYVVTLAKQNVIHWLMSKTIPIDANAKEGILQGRDLKKKKDKKKPDSDNDPIYGN
ncbi:MAG: hypothetical protein K2H01_00550 [Ruminococcus sp.]|nr:hypothetical protein [Ruminococcus sp.]